MSSNKCRRSTARKARANDWFVEHKRLQRMSRGNERFEDFCPESGLHELPSNIAARLATASIRRLFSSLPTGV